MHLRACTFQSLPQHFPAWVSCSTQITTLVLHARWAPVLMPTSAADSNERGECTHGGGGRNHSLSPRAMWLRKKSCLSLQLHELQLGAPTQPRDQHLQNTRKDKCCNGWGILAFIASGLYWTSTHGDWAWTRVSCLHSACHGSRCDTTPSPGDLTLRTCASGLVVVSIWESPGPISGISTVKIGLRTVPTNSILCACHKEQKKTQESIFTSERPQVEYSVVSLPVEVPILTCTTDQKHS